MAKKSLIVKAARPQKYRTRQYSRCNRCGRPRAVYKKFGLCRICLRELAHEGVIPGMTKLELVRSHDADRSCSGHAHADPERQQGATGVRLDAVLAHEGRDRPLLKDEGYIKDYRVEKGESFDTLVVELKFGPNRERVITDLKRVSKPGRRIYAKKDRLPRVLGGMGTAIISTSSGLVTSRTAQELGVGGEVVCFVW